MVWKSIMDKVKMSIFLTALFSSLLFSCLSTSNSDRLTKKDTDLINAIMTLDYDSVKKYLEMGANPNLKSTIMVSQLTETLGAEATMSLLGVHSIEELENLKQSALNIAIYQSSMDSAKALEIIKLLLQHRANPNEKIGTNTLLFLPVSLKNYDILKTLIDAGGNAKNGYIIKLRAGFSEKMNLLEYATDICADKPEIIDLIKKEMI